MVLMGHASEVGAMRVKPGPSDSSRWVRARWSKYRQLLANCIEGVARAIAVPGHMGLDGVGRLLLDPLDLEEEAEFSARSLVLTPATVPGSRRACASMDTYMLGTPRGGVHRLAIIWRRMLSGVLLAAPEKLSVHIPAGARTRRMGGQFRGASLRQRRFLRPIRQTCDLVAVGSQFKSKRCGVCGFAMEWAHS